MYRYTIYIAVILFKLSACMYKHHFKCENTHTIIFLFCSQMSSSNHTVNIFPVPVSFTRHSVHNVTVSFTRHSVHNVTVSFTRHSDHNVTVSFTRHSVHNVTVSFTRHSDHNVTVSFYVCGFISDHSMLLTMHTYHIQK